MTGLLNLEVSRPRVWPVSLGLLVIAGLFVYPFLSGLGSLLDVLGSGDSLTRAVATLVLAIVAMVFAYGLALALLAVTMLRGSRVAQLLACLLCGIVFGAPKPDTGPAIAVVLIAAAIVVLITVPPAAREFLAAYGRPAGVLIAAVTNVYLGFVALLDTVLLTLAGPLGAKSVGLGSGFAVLGVALIATNRPLRAGSQAARAVSVVTHFGMVVVLVVFGAGNQQVSGLSTLVSAGVVLAGLGGLTLARSSRVHFGRSRRESSPSATIAALEGEMRRAPTS